MDGAPSGVGTREQLTRDGAIRLAGLVGPEDLAAIRRHADRQHGGAGARLRTLPVQIGANDRIAGAVRTLIGDAARPVRAVLFDKTAERSWAVGWHQDRTIAVRARRDVPDFACWDVKDGIVHVAPPFALLARMVTMRIHLDAVDADNAPLLRWWRPACGCGRHMDLCDSDPACLRTGGAAASAAGAADRLVGGHAARWPRMDGAAVKRAGVSLERRRVLA
jgi:hypothetical protein